MSEIKKIHETRKTYQIVGGNAEAGFSFIIIKNGTILNFYEEDCFYAGKFVS